MQCPKCGGDLPDGSAICKHCDHIIDKSFLGDDYLDEDDRDEAAPQERPEPNPARRRRPPRTDEPPAPASWEPDRNAATDHRARRAAQDTPVDHSSAPDNGLSVEGSRVASDVESFLKKTAQAFQSLGLHDKLAVGGAVGMFLLCFFPWISVGAAGSLIGLEVDGWFAMLLAGAVVGLVYARHQKHWSDKEHYVLYAQVGVATVAVLFLLVKMSTLGKLKVTNPGLGVEQLVVAHVQGGLVLCFLSSLVSLAGVLLLFRDKVLRR